MFANFSSKERSLGDGSEGRLKLWPHSPQNLNSGEFGKLHPGQILSNLAPHSPQNFMPSGFSNWHFGHFISGGPPMDYPWNKGSYEVMSKNPLRGQLEYLFGSIPPP